MGDIFFSHDEKGRLAFVSGAFEGVTGWRPEESLGSDALRLVHPDDRALAFERLKAVMDGKTSDRFELRTLCKSGEYRMLEYRLSPLRLDGRVVGTIGVARDMTDQKLAEAALRQSEDRFRRITEWVTDYIFTVYVENGAPVRTVHGAACEAVTGYTAAEFAADPYLWIRMVPEEDCQTVLRQAASILAGGKAEAIEHRIVRKDGVVRWVRNTPAPHYDAQGRLISYDGLVRDVTELKRIEEQLRQTAKMEALGQLAGGIAHDFNNLLTAILGFANILKSSVPAGSDAHQAACTIERAAERASDMTARLLGFARKGKAQIAPVDLEATIT
ncbi:MAG TPA: PAS domain S-box protein, partial [Candidatus Brocadiia bacterium]|nr:PAS domain S-box protein [Candidatus Brocadiia bacterium]